MKKIILMLLLTVFFSAFTCISYGDDMVGTFTDIHLYLNETSVDSDVFVFKGESFLPVREVAEALNLDVKWNEDLRTISLSSRDSEKPLVKSNKVKKENRNYPVVYSDIKLFLNGEQIHKDIIVVSGSSYLPVKTLSEALGLNVSWDETSRRITLTKGTSIKVKEKPLTKQLKYTTCASATMSHLTVNDDFVYTIDYDLIEFGDYSAVDDPNAMLFMLDGIQYNAATIMDKHGMTRSQLIEELEMAGTNGYPLRITGSTKEYPYHSDCKFQLASGLLGIVKDCEGSYGINKNDLFNDNQIKKEKFIENFLYNPMDITIENGEITSVIVYYTP